jgi:hypothetical protein
MGNGTEESNVAPQKGYVNAACMRNSFMIVLRMLLQKQSLSKATAVGEINAKLILAQVEKRIIFKNVLTQVVNPVIQRAEQRAPRGWSKNTNKRIQGFYLIFASAHSFPAQQLCQRTLNLER